jgi:MFS transporter, ACS family, glucarate transporter
MKHRYRVLIFLFFLSIITFADRVCLSVAGKDMQQSLNLSPEQWGWVLGAFAIAYGLFEIPTGILADKRGPRRVLTRIVVWWSIFTSLTGAVTSYGQLLITRFLFGAGEAGAFPGCSATVSRWFPADERARAMGIVKMARCIGTAATPLLVIPLLVTWGWRSCFFVFGIVGIIWAVAWYGWFRDNPAEKNGVSAEEIAEIGSVSGGKTRHALPWRKAMKRPNFWLILVMYHTYCWGAYFYFSWLFVFLENGRDFSKSDLFTLSWLPFVVGAFANLLGGFTSDALVKRIGLKWGRRLVGLGGMGVSALFLGATMFTADKVWTIIFLAVGFAGSDFMLPVAWAVCLDIGNKYAGALTGAMNMAGQAGSFLTAVVFGYLVKAFGTYNAPLLPMAILTGVSAFLWLRIDPTEPLVAEDTAEG